jgi:hypothetical protein
MVNRKAPILLDEAVVLKLVLIPASLDLGMNLFSVVSLWKVWVLFQNFAAKLHILTQF